MSRAALVAEAFAAAQGEFGTTLVLRRIDTMSDQDVAGILDFDSFEADLQQDVPVQSVMARFSCRADAIPYTDADATPPELDVTEAALAAIGMPARLAGAYRVRRVERDAAGQALLHLERIGC